MINVGIQLFITCVSLNEKTCLQCDYIILHNLKNLKVVIILHGTFNFPLANFEAAMKEFKFC